MSLTCRDRAAPVSPQSARVRALRRLAGATPSRAPILGGRLLHSASRALRPRALAPPSARRPSAPARRASGDPPVGRGGAGRAPPRGAAARRRARPRLLITSMARATLARSRAARSALGLRAARPAICRSAAAAPTARSVEALLHVHRVRSRCSSLCWWGQDLLRARARCALRARHDHAEREQRMRHGAATLTRDARAPAPRRAPLRCTLVLHPGHRVAHCAAAARRARSR